MFNARCSAIAIFLLAASSGCGGSSSPGHPTASATAQEITIHEGGGALCVPCSLWQPVTISQAGVLRVRVNWTYASNWVTVAVTTSPCDYKMIDNRTCTILAYEGALPTVASKTATLLDARAGTYMVLVHNIGLGAESYQYQVTLTPAR